jgi:hypothetical protein
MNEQTFYDYLETQFVPYVQNLRAKLVQPNQRGILFMDNLYSPCSGRCLQIIADNNILVISFPPHTSHVFQMLDLVIFGAMKKHKASIEKNRDLNPSADLIFRVFRALELATCSTTIRASFQKAGFIYDVHGNSVILRVNEEKIRAS